MPRPRSTTNRVLWAVRIPDDLDAKLRILLMDPVTGRFRYRAKQDLVERLLRNWLNDQIKAQAEKQA